MEVELTLPPSKAAEYSDIDLLMYTVSISVRLHPRRAPIPPDPFTGKIKSPRPVLGTLRVTTWQGKNVQSSYPVYLEVSCNQLHARRYDGCTASAAGDTDDGGLVLVVGTGAPL